MKNRWFALLTAVCMVFAAAVWALPVKAAAEEESGWIFEVPVLILNGTGADIFELYISSSQDSSWGGDQLGTGILCTGEYIQLPLQFRSGGTGWDLKVVDRSGYEVTWYDVDVGEMPSSGFIMELLWDGETGYVNLAAGIEELAGDYGLAEKQAEISQQQTIAEEVL